jgi:hypothetical protein
MLVNEPNKNSVSPFAGFWRMTGWNAMDVPPEKRT